MKYPYVLKWNLTGRRSAEKTERAVYLSCGHKFNSFMRFALGEALICTATHDKICGRCGREYTVSGPGAAALKVTDQIDHWCFGCVQMHMGARLDIDQDENMD